MLALWMMVGMAMAEDTPEAAWLRSVFERPWEGVGVQETAIMAGGKIVTSHTLTWKGDATMHLKGTLETKLVLDNVPYLATHEVDGEYLSSTQSVALRAKLTRADTMPGGLTFCGFAGTLRVGNDADRPGHFAMQGPVKVDCGDGTVLIQLRDMAPTP